MDSIFDDLHFSSDQRAFTDPITNWVLIPGVTLERGLAGMLTHGRYPSSLFSPFIHEVTHHWCFHSPVGAALTALKMRARRNSLLLVTEQIAEENLLNSQWDYIEDQLRYETAMRLLQPLSEGLALFAEFDTAPGATEATSTPLNLSLLHFMPAEERKQYSDYNEMALTLLYHYRQKQEFQNRKINLLCHPLSCQDGGYLPGYLTLKNVRRILLTNCGCTQFLDSELFFCFIRSYFYEDWGLVATLLDPNVNEYNAIQAISVYIQQRMAALVHEIQESDVDSFLDIISKSRPTRTILNPGHQKFAWPELPVLNTPAHLVAAGKARLEKILTEVDNQREEESLSGALAAIDVWTMARREYVCIASFKEHIRVNEHGRVSMGQMYSNPQQDLNIPLFSGPGLEGITPDEGAGTVEVFFVPSINQAFMTVWLNGKLVIFHDFYQGLPDDLKETILGYTTSFADTASLRDLYTKMGLKVVEDSAIGAYAEHFISQTFDIVEDSYRTRALLTVPDDVLDECSEIMKETGFFQILGQDGDLIRAVSKLSLLCSLTIKRDVLSEEMSEAGYDLDATLEKLQPYEQKWGFSFFSDLGKVIICWI